MRILLLTVLFMTGCRHCGTCCGTKPNPVKWAAETGISTGIWPNAPYDGHPYLCEKVELSAKLRREW